MSDGPQNSLKFISSQVSTTVSALDRGQRRGPAGGMQLPAISSSCHKPRLQFFCTLAALVWPSLQGETRDLHSQAPLGLPQGLHTLQAFSSCLLGPEFPLHAHTASCWLPAPCLCSRGVTCCCQQQLQTSSGLPKPLNVSAIWSLNHSSSNKVWSFPKTVLLGYSRSSLRYHREFPDIS